MMKNMTVRLKNSPVLAMMINIFKIVKARMTSIMAIVVFLFINSPNW